MEQGLTLIKENTSKNDKELNKKIKVLAVIKFPTPFMDPLFRLWSNHPKIDLTVCYCVRTTDGISYYNANIGKKAQWGVKLLEGYKYDFLKEEMEPAGISDLKITTSAIKKYIRDNDFDVILISNSYWSLTTWHLIFSAKKKNIPMVTRMTVEAERKRGPLLLAVKKILVGKYCREMTAGVYECRQQKEYMEHYGMKSERLFPAPCAVNNDYFLEQSKKYNKRMLREEYNIPENDVVFISTGMLIERKRQKDVIEALARLKKDQIEPYYIMVGDGVEKKHYEDLIKNYNLKNVRLTGQLPQDEMSKYLKLSDVYIMASENDASPKALNEAMNFALPIIITTGCGTADMLLKNGENGYLYEPGNVEALEKAMRSLVEAGEKKREEMGRKSCEIVGECSYDRIIEGWVSACEYAIEKAGGR